MRGPCRVEACNGRPSRPFGGGDDRAAGAVPVVGCMMRGGLPRDAVGEGLKRPHGLVIKIGLDPRNHPDEGLSGGAIGTADPCPVVATIAAALHDPLEAIPAGDDTVPRGQRGDNAWIALRGLAAASTSGRLHTAGNHPGRFHHCTPEGCTGRGMRRAAAALAGVEGRRKASVSVSRGRAISMSAASISE